MALLVKTNGEIETITIPKKNSLKFLQEKVGGMIEIVGIQKVDRLKDFKQFSGMIVNEEGKMTGLKFNVKATSIYNNPYDVVVGDAIFFKDGEVD
jgi:hypothetical protein